MLPLLPSYDSNLSPSFSEKGGLLCASRAKVDSASTRCHCPKPSGFADSSRFQINPSSAIDPCVGDGVAFEVITNGAEVLRYGIELDAYRAEQARQRIPNIVQGNTLEVQCPVECFGLLYLNPPYDWTLGPADSRRTEQIVPEPHVSLAEARWRTGIRYPRRPTGRMQSDSLHAFP